MTNHKKETIDTYNTKAKSMAKKFDELGARVEDIERAFSFIDPNIENPFVVEIGCGNGRDAKVIIKKTNRYLGMDLSEELIKIARQNVPTAKFVVDDIETFRFPSDIDLIIAFASLLHVDKDTFESVLNRAHTRLNANGIIYISVMEGEYMKRRRVDKDGPRTFFHYNAGLIKSLVGDKYEAIYEDSHSFGGRNWLTIALRKKA